MGYFIIVIYINICVSLFHNSHIRTHSLSLSLSHTHTHAISLSFNVYIFSPYFKALWRFVIVSTATYRQKFEIAQFDKKKSDSVCLTCKSTFKNHFVVHTNEIRKNSYFVMTFGDN